MIFVVQFVFFLHNKWNSIVDNIRKSSKNLQIFYKERNIKLTKEIDIIYESANNFNMEEI